MTEIIKRSDYLVFMTIKRSVRYFVLLLFGLLFTVPAQVYAQDYELLIKGGHVIDPKNDIDGPMDVAVHNGRIARVGINISESSAERVVDASGLYVTPGLIDIHSHNYHGTVPNRRLSNSFRALLPDGFTFRVGVTTVVDVGGAGWTNFQHFKEQVIDRSRTRVLAFINIVGDGMSGGIPEQDLDDMNPEKTALLARQFTEIVGVKMAHYMSYDWEPYRRSAETGREAGIPVMIDLGQIAEGPALPLDTLFFEILRPGDIITHMYGHPAVGSYRDGEPVNIYGYKEGPLDDAGILRPHWREAQEMGIIFDVGHGGGSFFYEIAIPAFEQGLRPNTISTDIHGGSMNAGMKDMLNVVSKMMAIGMSLQEVIEASTWNPAQAIQREDLGHLSEGAEADIAVFRMREGSFGYMDAAGLTVTSNNKLEAELTIRAGQVVYDLNGIASMPWSEWKK